MLFRSELDDYEKDYMFYPPEKVPVKVKEIKEADISEKE